jgi:hypothetical protein
VKETQLLSGLREKSTHKKIWTKGKLIKEGASAVLD